MKHLLARFSWIDWVIIVGNLGVVAANLVTGEYLVAWLMFVIVGLFATGSVYRAMYDELLEDYRELRTAYFDVLDVSEDVK